MRLRTAAVLLLAMGARPAPAQTPAGPELAVNTYTTGLQLLPSVAMHPRGDFVVTWSGQGAGEDGYGVFAQRFGAAGGRLGSEFRVNGSTTGNQLASAVAAVPRGGFVVVWADVTGDPSLGIRGQRFDALANRLGAEFQVNQYTTGGQTFPQVDVGPDGGFVVTWQSAGADGAGMAVAGRRFGPEGAPLADEFVVNTYTTGNQSISDVAVAPDRSFVVVWDDDSARDGTAGDIRAQRFDAAGARLGDEFQVNAAFAPSQRTPSIGMGPLGEFVVAWAGTDGYDANVLAMRFDAVGAPRGSEFIVNTYTALVQYVFLRDIANDQAGDFVVSWMSLQDGSSWGVFGQRFDGDGIRRGSEFRVNTYTTSHQLQAGVASDVVGNFVVGWTGNLQDGSSLGIFAQRFGGLRPEALVVDNGGNGVLEPGETAGVRPSWRNDNGAAQAFGGTLGAIAGPPGTAQTITDGTADYGTVASGTSASCTDCYAVQIADPGPRPLTHWDASALESLTPDTQGQRLRWRLHVGASFTDVSPSRPFYRFVETLLHHGVTGGCTAAEYCPTTSTTREQMAPFALVAKEGTAYSPPACTTPVFPDVPASSPFCRWIEELARRGVVGGCGGGNYCPGDAVTREQMAIFVLRTLDPALSPPACGTPMFGDVPSSSPFCRWIEELVRRGVVTGCGGGNFCPSAPVTREQMGVFIGATFGLALYGP